MKIIQTIMFDDQKRRVIVFQRDDGSFGFEEQRFSEKPLESPWHEVGDHSATRLETVEGALIEARHHVPWLAEARRGGAS